MIKPKITIIQGSQGSGKTTLAYNIFDKIFEFCSSDKYDFLDYDNESILFPLSELEINIDKLVAFIKNFPFKIRIPYTEDSKIINVPENIIIETCLDVDVKKLTDAEFDITHLHIKKYKA